LRPTAKPKVRIGSHQAASSPEPILAIRVSESVSAVLCHHGISQKFVMEHVYQKVMYAIFLVSAPYHGFRQIPESPLWDLGPGLNVDHWSTGNKSV
jgi:hypothetical protein